MTRSRKFIHLFKVMHVYNDFLFLLQRSTFNMNFKNKTEKVGIHKNIGFEIFWIAPQEDLRIFTKIRVWPYVRLIHPTRAQARAPTSNTKNQIKEKKTGCQETINSWVSIFHHLGYYTSQERFHLDKTKNTVNNEISRYK